MQELPSLAKKIRAERLLRGWSQADLGQRIGITQAAIKKIETGQTAQSKHLPRIALELGINLTDYLSRVADPTSTPTIFERGGRDLPIYAAAMGGRGEIIRSIEPVDWVGRPMPLANVREAYGIYVVGDSMAPEFRPGEIALVNPHLPTVGGEVYIFFCQEDGQDVATIAELRRATGDKWLIHKHNPETGQKVETELSRQKWNRAHRVVGKLSRP